VGIDFTVPGTIDIPLSLLGDGHQEILLVPQDPTLLALFPVTSTPFDVIDMSYELHTDPSSGIDTYLLLDHSDGTSTIVNPEHGQSSENPIEALDLLQPQGDTTTFELNFDDHVVVGSAADFNNAPLVNNPIDHIIFGDNGFIQFAGQEGGVLPITQDNVQQAIDYLAQNSKHIEGATVAFNVDNNGVNSSYVFHQSEGGFSVVNVSDTAPDVAGIETQHFNSTTIHIVDNH